jgi:hypothetical protein
MFLLPAGLLLAASLLGGAESQVPVSPDLAFVRYPKYGETNFDPPPTVLRRIEKAGLKMSAARAKELLQRLLEDRMPASDLLDFARGLRLDVSPAQRQELISREKAASQDPETMAMIVGEVASYDVAIEAVVSENPLYRVRVLDWSASGQADLVLIPDVYYGPSNGFKFYGRRGDHIEYLGEHSGDIRRIDENPSKVLLRLLVSILDPSETGVLLNIRFDRRQPSWAMTREYYAQQTEIPARPGAPRAMKTLRAAELRTGPRADDGPAHIGTDDHFQTTTLKGNIVARIPTSAAGFVYALSGEWAFAAFGPGMTPLETSLYHDLDHTLDMKRAARGASPIPTYLCGWVRRDALAMGR